MSIYLTLDNLNDLISSKSLKILKKNQKENGTNYYFTPNLVLKLYGAKVIFINPKFLVFQFCKIKNSSLYLLLKSINSILLNELKKTHSEMFNKEIYSFFSDVDDKFTIRCYLPNYKNKYFIQCESSDNSVNYFTLPKHQITYDMITIEIRNVWYKNEKGGFNIELKGVYYNFS